VTSGACGTPDTGGGCRACGQPALPDRLTASEACAVRAVVEPADGSVDLRELFEGPGKERGGVLPLERERRALRVVLVVGARPACGIGDTREFPVQGRRPPAGTGSLREQQRTGSGHPSDFRLPGLLPVPGRPSPPGRSQASVIMMAWSFRGAGNRLAARGRLLGGFSSVQERMPDRSAIRLIVQDRQARFTAQLAWLSRTIAATRTLPLTCYFPVELRGFEPLTPSMRTRCATGLRYSPENRSQPSKLCTLLAPWTCRWPLAFRGNVS
jgi:hypothetical protein